MLRIRIMGLAIIAVFAFGAVAVSSASATKFKCTSYPCMVLAPVTGGSFVVEGTEVKCTGGEFTSGTLSADSELLLVTPVYSSCKAFGFVGATVNMNGCNYVFHTNGTVDIEPSGCGPIKITASTCETLVNSQTGLSTIAYDNAQEAGAMVVKVLAKVTGIHATTDKTGIGCPKVGLVTNATYTETSTVKGLNGGTTVGVLVE
jgi:hypothetical protein